MGKGHGIAATATHVPSVTRPFCDWLDESAREQVADAVALVSYEVIANGESGGVLAWLSCLERGADLHMAQLMPLPLTVFCFSKIQIGFTFLVPAHLGSHGIGLLNGCVCLL